MSNRREHVEKWGSMFIWKYLFTAGHPEVHISLGKAQEMVCRWLVLFLVCMFMYVFLYKICFWLKLVLLIFMFYLMSSSNSKQIEVILYFRLDTICWLNIHVGLQNLFAYSLNNVPLWLQSTALWRCPKTFIKF